MEPLDIERSSSDVNTKDLALLLHGGATRLAKLREIWDSIENDPAFSKVDRPSLNHIERYNDACRKIRRFAEVVREYKKKHHLSEISLDDLYDLYLPVDENLPLDVHLSMFIPIMAMHTDDEQKRRWLEKSLSFEIIGAYAQTELAHGSNVRGIETTAMYDSTSETFDLHSPTLTSTKWWPGGLGKTCTHAVVYANLIIKTRNYGPHPFMVRVRSELTHKPCEGIEMGDIGAKLGYNSMDNGYARFSHVKIPRLDMLRGFAKVSEDGTYTKSSGSEKISYGIMLDVRCRIVANSAYVLARALTIAIRYSCVRLQGSLNPSGSERKVIDYPTQRRVLVPALGFAFALHFTGVAVKRQYNDYIQTRDLAKLPDLHCATAGLKGLVTIRVSDAMESARKMCGGHGFLQNAGFGDLLTSYLPFCTLEGTREVLGQQSGRYLVKQLIQKRTSKGESNNTAYLSEDNKTASYADIFNKFQFENLETEIFLASIVRTFMMRSKYIVQLASAAVASFEPSHRSADTPERKAQQRETALIDAGVELLAASEAHAELLIVQSFFHGLQSVAEKITSETMLQLQNLFKVLCLSLVEQHAGEFISANLLLPQQLVAISKSISAGCDILRGHLVNLVEAWCFSDQRLGSTLGRRDGKYAEALYQAALQEPLNTNSEGYNKHLKFVLSPFAKSKL